MWFPHFRHGQRAMNMNSYTNAELVNIHFIYGLANGSGRVAVRLTMIDDMPINSEMDLVARFSITAATICETPGIFEHVRQSVLFRCSACIHADNSNFKHLL
ncbi:hypothetical protein TNCV_4351391 [Trichonephila clavipes]|nr:hypothetical protein TNCV_4351391 [Trichonephila clavipes]